MAITRRTMITQCFGGLVAAGLPALPSIAQGEVGDSKRVAGARLLGGQFRDNPLNITGQDAASSFLLPNHDALWLFGDTVEGPFETIRGLPLEDKLSNTALIAPPQDAASGIRKYDFLADAGGKRARQIIPFVDGETPSAQRLWPIHGICQGEHAYVFYHRISLLPGVDVFENFQLDGMGIARATIGNWHFERLPAPDGSLEFWKGDQPTYGVFVEQRDGYVYLWGNLMTGMFLTRTRPRSITDLSSYEYLVEVPTIVDPNRKPRWSNYYEPTAALFDSVPNEMSAAYNKHLGCYIAIHSFLRENKIVLRTAPEITGPWSEPEIVYRPERIKDDDLIYAAKEHPELARKNGRVIYVTFVNSSTYVPQLVELTLN